MLLFVDFSFHFTSRYYQCFFKALYLNYLSIMRQAVMTSSTKQSRRDLFLVLWTTFSDMQLLFWWFDTNSTCSRKSWNISDWRQIESLCMAFMVRYDFWLLSVKLKCDNSSSPNHLASCRDKAGASTTGIHHHPSPLLLHQHLSVAGEHPPWKLPSSGISCVFQTAVSHMEIHQHGP